MLRVGVNHEKQKVGGYTTLRVSGEGYILGCGVEGE